MVRSRISCFKSRLVFVWVVPVLLLGMYQTVRGLWRAWLIFPRVIKDGIVTPR